MEMVGLAAAACVLATFCMQSIVALRGFAMVSNLLFIIYGADANLMPIVLLHAVLLPINGWSLGKLFGGRATAVAFGVCSVLRIIPSDNRGNANAFRWHHHTPRCSRPQRAGTIASSPIWRAPCGIAVLW